MRRTKIGFAVLTIVLLLVVVNITTAGLVWQCHGMCYGCELWNCDAHEGSECCAYCNYGGGEAWCCYPTLCNAKEI